MQWNLEGDPLSAIACTGAREKNKKKKSIVLEGRVADGRDAALLAQANLPA